MIEDVVRRIGECRFGYQVANIILENKQLMIADPDAATEILDAIKEFLKRTGDE